MRTKHILMHRRIPFIQTPMPGNLGHHIIFTQDVSLAGSIYTQNVTSTLTLSQQTGDYYPESNNNTINFIQEVKGIKETSQSVNHALTFVHENNYSGGRLLHCLESIHTATFNSNTIIGQPIYIVSNNVVDLAIANDITKSQVMGLAIDNFSAGENGNYVTEGYIERSDWTSIIGSTDLTPGAIYYLDPNTAGLLTDTSPTTITDYVVKIGRAVNQKQLDIEIEVPILL